MSERQSLGLAIAFLVVLGLFFATGVYFWVAAPEQPLWRVVEVEGVSCIAHGTELVACDWGAAR